MTIRYLPKDRIFTNPKKNEFKSFSKNKNIFIPNPEDDDITVNNIAWQEFDYTEDPLDEE